MISFLSPSEPWPRDDISSSDDEPRDLTHTRSLSSTSSPDMTRSLSDGGSPVSSPEVLWGGQVISSPHPATMLLPSPRATPELELDTADRKSGSKRRLSVQEDDDDEEGYNSSGSNVKVMPGFRNEGFYHRKEQKMTILSNGNHRSSGSGTGSGADSFWQSPLAAGMGMSLSMAVHHHPYLALSFQRLQQMHMRAAQEGGLHKLSPFAPHLPLPGPHPGQPPLPFSHLPTPFTGPHPSPPPPSPVQPRSGDYPFPAHGTRLDFQPQRSPPTPSQVVTSHQHPHVLPVSPQRVMTSPVTREEPLPLDLDTKTAAEKRKRREGEPPRYNCEACGKTYSTFSGLSKHKQFHCASHIQKQFNCKYCDKTYVSLGALKMHIRTHTLPCKCHLCGKAFSRPWLLQGHVRTHTGEKPFQCAHCGRSFADRSNLRAHLQTHSDVKKYSCRTCSKTFSRMSLLLKHEDGGCAGLGH